MQIKNSLNGLIAGCAIVAGWWAYGWQGIVFSISLIVFWMLVQFNRAARAMQKAGQQPVGYIDSVVMLQARLAHGMQLAEAIALAGSLGRKFSDRDEWQWTDAAGHEIVLTFRRGRLIRWAVARNEAATESPPDADVPPHAAAEGEQAANNTLAVVR
ncbi:MAG: hypothetical protein ABI574_14205 [Burkholderiales bacterium]